MLVIRRRITSVTVYNFKISYEMHFDFVIHGVNKV